MWNELLSLSPVAGERMQAQRLNLIPSFLNNLRLEVCSPLHASVYFSGLLPEEYFTFQACFVVLSELDICEGGKGNSKSFKCSCLKPLCLCLYLLWTYSLPLGLCFQIWISLGGMFWPTYFALQIYLAKFCRNSPTVLSQSCHLLFCLPPSQLPSMRQKPPARVLHPWSRLFCHWQDSFSAVGRAQRLNSPVLPVCRWLGSAACLNLG